MMELTSEQRRRYDRHIILDGMGRDGQRRILDAKVLVVGAGGPSSRWQTCSDKCSIPPMMWGAERQKPPQSG